LKQCPDIVGSDTVIVNLVAFSASSVDIMIYAFTRTPVWTEFHQVKQKVLLEVAAIVARHGAQIAYPTRTLHVSDLPHAIDAVQFSQTPASV
jgi:MscS family membrane protein